MKHKTEYLNSGGVFCPYCKNPDIEGGPVEIQGGTATQEMGCTRCDGEWQDQYTLSDVIETRKYRAMPQSSERLLILDVDATKLFADKSDDWKYCVEQAPFSHRDACEFMIYIGMEDDQTFDDRLREMHMHNEVSEDFLELMRIARQQQAVWLLLHA